MTFVKYQHLERFGTPEVQNIELGTCYVFPKLDGTNASLWAHEDQVFAGSRSRTLSLEEDNAGFYAWVLQQEHLFSFFTSFPHLRLYGEWLVPHSLKTYRPTAWRKFYVFDVLDHSEIEEGVHVPFDAYAPILDQFGIEYIPPIAKIINGSYEQFINQLAVNVFLIEDGKGAGEGIVIKNYDYKNKYGRQTWAKIVTSEFKDKHRKEMGCSEIQGKKTVEESIAETFVTKALVEKVFAKIDNDGGWTSKRIPQLLNTVYYDVVREDAWNFVKAHKNPTINFGTLQFFVFYNVKKHKAELF